MSGHMTRTTVPTPGTNKLTQRLLAQGVKLEDHHTWPEGVWACEINNFGYSREYRFTPTWESPCGLLIHEHGDMWGETWAEGEFKCAENDNPLFGCPKPGVPCPHRKKLPAGINCQFHRTDREWNEADSVERLRRLRLQAEREILEADWKRYPGFTGFCPNVRTVDMPDGSVKRLAKYRVENCISGRCPSTQCACRLGAARDISPANIFYDLYTERTYTEGLLTHTEKEVLKGLKVFERPVARTDAEIALKFWMHDPDSVHVPFIMRRKLDIVESCDSKERFFVRHHQYWNGHTGVVMKQEIRNIRIARNEQRDMLRDLQDVRDGIRVEHQSDHDRAAKAQKTERRQAAKVRKMAKVYANEEAEGRTAHSITGMLMQGEKPEFQRAVKDEARRILDKRQKKAEKEAAKAAQVTLFDIMGGAEQ